MRFHSTVLAAAASLAAMVQAEYEIDPDSVPIATRSESPYTREPSSAM